ncbi:MAG: cation:proton antiporter [Myxococcales bacterium]|jgi:cell volume regulation protein A|nr:cation:proton antiporter [Myxococcales bacterium]
MSPPCLASPLFSRSSFLATPDVVAAADASVMDSAAGASGIVDAMAAGAAQVAVNVATATSALGPTLSVSLFLILVAGIFLVGVVGEAIFDKTGIPDVLWLILVGIIVGPIFGLAQREILAQVAPYFGALTLIIVLFNGGSELRLGELKEAAPRALLLAILSFAFSVLACACLSMLAKAIGWLPAAWTWMHGICLGGILGGSSSIVVMPALKKARLNATLSNMTNLESALTDIFCVVAIGACIQIMLTGSSDPLSATVALGKSFGIGVALGFVAGILGLLVLRKLSGEHAYPLTLGALILLYVLVDALDGSAALAILTTAVILGNARAFSRKIGLAQDAYLDHSIKDVHGQIAFFIKSFFFTFIGAMLGAPWGLVLVGVLFGFVLLAVRIPAVFLATMRSTLDMDSRKIAAVFLPRGMAAGVLSMMPHAMGVPGTEKLPVLVFAAIVTTIVLFSVGFPMLKWRIARAQQGRPTEETVAAQPAQPSPVLASATAEAGEAAQGASEGPGLLELLLQDAPKTPAPKPFLKLGVEPLPVDEMGFSAVTAPMPALSQETPAVEKPEVATATDIDTDTVAPEEGEALSKAAE